MRTLLTLSAFIISTHAFSLGRLLPLQQKPSTILLESKTKSSNPEAKEVPTIIDTPEEIKAKKQTAALCVLRNINFDCIKNARDLASVKDSPIKPGRLYRMGKLSDASDSDIAVLKHLDIKTVVDLRSPTEWRDDELLNNPKVFRDFTTLVWTERNGKVTEKEVEMKASKKKGSRAKGVMDGIKTGVYAATHNPHHNATHKTRSDLELDDLHNGKVTEKEVEMKASKKKGSRKKGSRAKGMMDGIKTGVYAATHNPHHNATHKTRSDLELDDLHHNTTTVVIQPNGTEIDHKDRKERHFVSLMDEFKYVRGTLSKLRRRDVARVLIKSPGAMFSKRVRTKVKDVFLSEINDGGLPMLNDLLLRMGAPGIKYVLELIADENRHPVVFYCTAGKDRTGMIAALILSVCGVPDKNIVEDYSLSANVYAQINDHKAMVGALSQRNLDAKTFLGAPPQVMRDTLESVNEHYGSVEGYLDWIGFDEKKREKLKKVLTT